MKASFTPKTLMTVLSSQAGTKKLIKRANFLSELNTVLQAHLSPTLSKHCRVGQFEKGILTISTDSPAFRHHLRFYQGNLLLRLQETQVFAQLKKIRCIVVPGLSTEENTNKKAPSTALPPPPEMSETTADYLKTMAHYIEHPGLQTALRKLAKHHKKTD